MRATALRLGLSLMVVISLWSGRVAAQGVFVVPTVPYDPDHYPPSLPFAPKPPPPPAKHLYKRVMNHFGMGCQADPWGSVQNFSWEANWMFGSSRSWFFETCTPTQPCADRRAER
jgi:hypothetical protein